MYICRLDPRTRVALYLQNGVPNSDYINANFIRVRNITVHQCLSIARYYNKLLVGLQNG